MRILSAACLVSRLRLSAAALACLGGLAVATAQPLQFGFNRPAPVELAAPRVGLVSGQTATRLEQVRALADANNWDEAIDILRELATQRDDAVVDLGNGRYVSLRSYCHLQLARMPAEGLAAYRRRVDPLAERWFQDGVARRDENLLREIVDELFCSGRGDDALLALGELALERGDYAAARRNWEQISPLLRDPTGQPMWLALRDVDLAAHWSEVERRWRERPKLPAWLAYPDTQLNLADIRARLILTSIRAGDLKRAALELDAFRRFHPTAEGRLGGQHGLYAGALENLLASAEQWMAESPSPNWPTFAGSQARSPAGPKLGPITGPAWAQPIELRSQAVARINLPRGVLPENRTFNDWPEDEARETARPLSCFPAVVDGVVLYGDEWGIHAAELDSGKPAITRNGSLHRDDSPEAPRKNVASPIDLGWRDFEIAAHGVPRHTLNAIDGIVYGRVGRLATAHVESHQSSLDSRLVGVDLRRDGVLAFRVRTAEAAWSFDGVPVGDGRRLFVAMRQSDVTPHAYVACFDATMGSQVWRTSIGAADTPAAGLGDEITHNLLTLAGDRIYFNTNLGLVAALDADSGEVCWIRRYDRLAGKAIIGGQGGSTQFDRDPAPCVYHKGLVIVAPSDTPNIFALDADTGQTVWTTGKLPDVVHLLGVVRHNLIASGNRLAALDVRSGDVQFVWPESQHAGIRGMGRGVVAGDEVFWPTRNEIYVIHGMTGAQSRPPIPLGSISNCGANLAAAAGRLVVAGYDKLMAFGPALPVPPNQKKSKSEPVAAIE
jgi:outer membrane protein assembly factor BamB